MNPKDNEKSIMSSIIGFFSGNLISRGTGFFREIAMVICLGANPAVASFWIAFRVLFFLRRVLGESLINMTFIPYFEGLRCHFPEKVGRFLKQITGLLLCSSITLVLLAECVLFFLYKSCSVDNRFIILLTMLLLPGGVFLVLYALNSAVLLCDQKFFIAGAAPALVNVFWIGILLVTYRCSSELTLIILSACLVGGFFFQWAVTVKPIRKIKSLYPDQKDHKDGYYNLIKLIPPIALSLIGIAANYFNGLSDMFLARRIDPVGPAFLWYALRIQQLPLSMLTVGIFSALLPPISRAVEFGDKDKAQRLMVFALKLTSFLMLTVTFGVCLVGLPGLDIIYGHGRFSYEEVLRTFKILLGYVPGLIPVSLVSIVNVLFYSKKTYAIPAIIGCLSVICNIVLSYVFGVLIYKDVAVIALVTSITAWGQLILLWLFSGARDPIYKNIFKSLIPLMLKILVVLNPAYWAVRGLFALFPGGGIENSYSFLLKLGLLIGKGGLFISLVILFMKIMRIKDFADIFNIGKIKILQPFLGENR